MKIVGGLFECPVCGFLCQTENEADRCCMRGDDVSFGEENDYEENYHDYED